MMLELIVLGGSALVLAGLVVITFRQFLGAVASSERRLHAAVRSSVLHRKDPGAVRHA